MTPLIMYLNKSNRLASFLIGIRRSSSTIYALASGHGKCGVSVIRVSGPEASRAVKRLTKTKILPEPRLATLKYLYDPESGVKIDRGLILWFPRPKSFTGEDCAEFQVHGGLAVVGAILGALGKIKGLRPAEAGEFTKRAFLSGKMDLTQVEGLGDLIHAETEHQRRQALRAMEGDLHNLYDGWRKDIIRCMANVEAYIDFSEAESLESGILEGVNTSVDKLIKEIQNHLLDFRAGERLRNGVHIAIIGEPNVGKSSLLNLLVHRPAAIVSPIAGTTRDLVEVKFNIKGYPVVIVDTAGLRNKTDDVIEKEGISRAIQASKMADLIIYIKDATDFDNDSNLDLELPPTPKKIVVINKIDLCQNKDFRNIDDAFVISCKDNTGVPKFLDFLASEVEKLCQTLSGDSPSLTRVRYKTHLEQALLHLQHYLNYSSERETFERNVDIAAHQLRKAIREIGCITGQIDPEKILDVIFADFCIGK